MALPPPSVSSIPDLNVNNVPNETPKTQRDLLANMPMAMNTQLTRPAIDAGTYPETARLIAGFIRGMTMKVTYYAQQRQGSANDRTAMTDYPAERDVLSTEYWRILNFELKLKENVTYSFDPSKPNSDIDYQAFVYPGQQPNTGDKMLYELGPGQLVILTVNQVENLSFYQDTAYLISFGVQSFVDKSDMDALNGATTEEFVFTRGMTGGTPYSIITSESYILLQFITAFRSELIQYYFDTFYSDVLNSFSRPDGVYDPTCVRFMVSKISIRDTGRRCAILYRDLDKLYNQSIWGRLESRYVSSTKALSSTYFLTTAAYDGFSAFFNELYDRAVVLPRPYQPVSATGTRIPENGMAGYLQWANYTPVIIGPTGWIDYSAKALQDYNTQSPNPPPYYAFSKAFWENIPAEMSATESHLMDMILNRTITETDPKIIKTYFQSVYDMNDMEQYYTIPVMIHMIDILKRVIPQTVNARNI